MSMTEQIGADDANTLYLSIVGGNMVQKVEEGTPGAKRREYEASDGSKGVKFEIHHKNLTGKITGLEFRDGNYGEQFILTLWSWDEQVKLHLNTDGRYFAPFAKKLPNVDLEKEITINSFDFTTTDGTRLIWMDVRQNWLKLNDYYWDKENKKAINWMIPIDEEKKEKMKKKYWPSYFLEASVFLKEEVEKIRLPISDSQPLNIDEANDVFE